MRLVGLRTKNKTRASPSLTCPCSTVLAYMPYLSDLVTLGGRFVRYSADK